MSMILWPDNEKPREKMLDLGVEALSNAELLAILFGSGSRQKDVMTIARDLLNHYGNLQSLFNADFDSLCQHSGIGMAKFCQLQACIELNRRHLAEPLSSEQQFIDSTSVKRYLVAMLRDLSHEVFTCLFMDTRFRLIRFETLFTGTLNTTVVHPREVTKRALLLNTAYVIIAHNHPSGELHPSDADLKLTKHINQALSLVDIKLIDHIIVGGPKALSLSEHGYEF